MDRNEWMEGRKNRWMDGWRDRWMDGCNQRMDACMNEGCRKLCRNVNDRVTDSTAAQMERQMIRG